MAAEIPTGFKFSHILGHSFPGFFTAITVFMALDIMSPLDLTSYVIGSKGIDGIVAFAGFVLLIGSILGVIIDGIHHLIVRKIFKGDKTLKQMIDNRKNLLSAYYCIINKENSICGKCTDEKEKTPECSFYKEVSLSDREQKKICYYDHYKLNNYYLFKELDDKFITINDYAIDNFYSYFEFHSNTFIALFPFSFIAPIYAYSVLQISGPFIPSSNIPILPIVISCITCFVASICILTSYDDYVDYLKGLNAVYRGYIDPLRKKTAKGTYTIKGEVALDEKSKSTNGKEFELNGEVELEEK